MIETGVRPHSEATRGVILDQLSHNHDNRVDSFQTKKGKCLSIIFQGQLLAFFSPNTMVSYRCVDKHLRALQIVLTPYFSVTEKWCHYHFVTLILQFCPTEYQDLILRSLPKSSARESKVVTTCTPCQARAFLMKDGLDATQTQGQPTQALHLSPPLKMLNAKNGLMQNSKTDCSKNCLKKQER